MLVATCLARLAVGFFALAPNSALAQGTTSTNTATTANLLGNGGFNFSKKSPTPVRNPQTISSDYLSPWFFSTSRPPTNAQSDSDIFLSNTANNYGQLYRGATEVGQSLLFNSTAGPLISIVNTSSSLVNLYAANQIVNSTGLSAPNYTLSFSYAKYYTSGSVECPLHARTLQVFINGNSIITLDPDNQTSVVGLNWMPFSVNFTLADRKST